MLTTPTLITLSLQFADSFSKKDALSIGKLLANDFCLFDPALKWIRGKNEVIHLLKKQFEESENVNYQVLNAYQDANTSILEFKLTMDQKTFEGVDFIVWENEKMVELRCYYNPPDLAPG